MRLPFHRKNPAQRVVETITDKLTDKPAKVGLAATGGLAALTAASAGISSLRRQARR
jgi:hypothetical protein